MTRSNATLAALLLGLAMTMAQTADGRGAVLPGWSEQKLDAGHWVARWPGAERIVLDADDAAARNARLFAVDASMTDLAALPTSMRSGEIRERVLRLSALPTAPRYFADGRLVGEDDRQRWVAALNLATLDAEAHAVAEANAAMTVGWALVTQRAPLRTFPTLERVFSAPGDADIDRFQESAFFPGTPVAVLHASSDGRWRFVVGTTYAAWIPEGALAYSDRDTALAFAARATRLMLEPVARLAYTPELPAVSGLELDMGATLPERRDWPLTDAVNGQGVLASFVVEVPTRGADGRLVITDALLPRGAASHDGPLPASRANLLRQAFRFLGERYGWGHDHGSRDCSGFVSEVYRSVGLVLPRNTRDQMASAALGERIAIPADWAREQRLAALRDLAPGDLAYLPGHVVMIIGHDGNGPWVIHDVHRGRVPGPDGALIDVPMNGVVATPLLPLHASDGRAYVDALTAIQRVLPRDAADGQRGAAAR